jgi:uncharacterized membrane protein
MKTERLQALCDGVFAIAITLLVLELPVPEESHDLARDLLDRWHSYAAYVVSFVTIAIVWINHHALMDRVRQADRTLLELNLLLLLFVALIPWPTGLLAEYLRDDRQASTAAAVYGGVMALMASSFTLIWVYLQRQQDLAHPAARAHLGTAVRRSLVGPTVYVAGTFVALASAPAAFAIYAGAAAFFGRSGRRPRISTEPR